MIKYLSPSAFMLYRRDPAKYYLQYLSPNPLPRTPATPAMEVGSVFDLLVKWHLNMHLGIPQGGLDKQLQPYGSKAVLAGWHVYEVYEQSGAFNDLYQTLLKATDIQMEQRRTRDVNGCIIGGLADLSYVSAEGVPVIVDFKVNGYYSAGARSPVKGYLKLRYQEDHEWKTKQHRDVVIARVADVPINSAYGFEECYPDWAIQLNFYGWILGYDEFVTQIEQIVAKPNDPRPILRIASHSTMSKMTYQKELREQVREVWDLIHSDHFFQHVSKEESDEICYLLDQRARVREEPDTLTLIDLDTLLGNE